MCRLLEVPLRVTTPGSHTAASSSPFTRHHDHAPIISAGDCISLKPPHNFPRSMFLKRQDPPLLPRPPPPPASIAKPDEEPTHPPAEQQAGQRPARKAAEAHNTGHPPSRGDLPVQCSRRLKEEVATVLRGPLSFTAKCQIEPLWGTYTRASVEWHAQPGRSQGAFSRFSRLFFF
jgi:hypothetical protein